MLYTALVKLFSYANRALLVSQSRSYSKKGKAAAKRAKDKMKKKRKVKKPVRKAKPAKKRGYKKK